MYSYFQAYQAEWLYKNFFLFSSREQSKAIMGLTSEKEYVSWCVCCQWFMNTVHLSCHACVDSVQLADVLLARTLSLGERTFAGLSFPQETQSCVDVDWQERWELCWLAGIWKDQSFVDWQERSELCWLAGIWKDQSFVDWQERSELCWLAGIWKDQSFVDWQKRWGLCWLAGKMRALLTGRKDQSFVDWQGRSELCWLVGEIRALLTGREDQSFVDW